MARLTLSTNLTVDMARTIMYELDDIYPGYTFWFASQQGDLHIPEFMHAELHATSDQDPQSDLMEIGAYIQKRQTELLINHGDCC